MKVVFLENVPNVARIGEIKEVADGYGRNYLIPHKLALLAKPEVIEKVPLTCSNSQTFYILSPVGFIIY